MYKFTFKNHNIPEVSLSAINRNEIFYLNSENLSVFNIDEGTTRVLDKCKNPSDIFIFKQDLYVLDGNNLLKYRQNKIHSSIKLQNYPLKTKITENGIVFVYDNFIQIYDGSILSIETNIQEKFIDICFIRDDCYLLTSKNIYKMKNIFYTRMLSFRRKVSILPEPDFSSSKIFYKSIDSDSNFLFLSSESSVEKYKVFDTFISLELDP